MKNRNTFGKEERLKSRKLISSVFGSGESFLQFPVKVTLLITDYSSNNFVKTGVGVSSRYFKRAVDRNQIKRLLRETYRINKHPLTDFCKENKVKIALFFLYIDKQLPEYKALEKVIQIAIIKLINKLTIEKRQLNS